MVWLINSILLQNSSSRYIYDGILITFAPLKFGIKKALQPWLKSIQQNIVNKSLQFQIIVIPLHPFLYRRGNF
jgi:hypothetical protein